MIRSVSPAILVLVLALVTSCLKASTTQNSRQEGATGSPDDPGVVADEPKPERRRVTPVASVDDEDQEEREEQRLPTSDERDGEQEPVSEQPEQDGDCYKGDPFLCAVEVAVVRQTNALRSNLAPMQHSPKMSFVARQWSERQAQNRFISHAGFPSERAQAYRQEFGRSVRFSAENVAMTYANGSDPEAVARVLTNTWWRSLGHRLNMLGRHSHIGVGVARVGNQYYATQIFGSE